MHGGKVEQTGFVETIPFDFDKGLPLIQVEIQGNEYTFLLDTGAPNVISQELADEISYEKGVSIDIKDSQGEKKKQKSVMIDNIRIGDIDFANTGAIIIDYGDVFEMKCMGFDGIIGANLMSKLTWEIDYKNSTVSFSDIKHHFDVPADAEVIPFVPKAIQRTPVIQILVNEAVFDKVTFDTGANGAINLRKDKADQVVKELAGFDLHGNLSAGIYGSGAHSVEKYGVVDSLKIGSLELEAQVVSFESSGSMTLGNKFLKYYRVIIDWNKDEIYLIKEEGYDKKEYKSFGFFPKKVEDKLMVMGIVNESFAGQQGVELDMQIMEINGVDYRNVTDSLGCAFITSKPFEELDEIMVTFLIEEKEVELNLKKADLIKYKQ
ncbi:hypothetical protein GCM10007940_19380 [Portibacter lacus]|uniref:PDZ domain-containing protein n=2 Tax=Portibacter lacus TaxID=1099794 RepID=A0AA37WDW3_9BACT|nr:hypothetical protein GCM10007940_19380 [Portibacter lacus]